MVTRVFGSPASTVIGATWYDRRNDTHNLRFAAGRSCSRSVPMQTQDRVQERDRRERCIGVLPRRTRRRRQRRGPSPCLAFSLPVAPRAWWRAARSGRAANSSTSRTGGVQLGNLSLALPDSGIQPGSPIRRPTPSGSRAGSRHPAAGLPAENGDSRNRCLTASAVSRISAGYGNWKTFWKFRSARLLCDGSPHASDGEPPHARGLDLRWQTNGGVLTRRCTEVPTSRTNEPGSRRSTSPRPAAQFTLARCRFAVSRAFGEFRCGSVNAPGGQWDLEPEPSHSEGHRERSRARGHQAHRRGLGCCRPHPDRWSS